MIDNRNFLYRLVDNTASAAGAAYPSTSTIRRNASARLSDEPSGYVVDMAGSSVGRIPAETVVRKVCCERRLHPKRLGLGCNRVDSAGVEPFTGGWQWLA